MVTDLRARRYILIVLPLCCFNPKKGIGMMVDYFCVFKEGQLIFMSTVEEQAVTKFRSMSGDNFARIQNLTQLESMLTNPIRFRQTDSTSDQEVINEEVERIVEKVFDGVSYAMESACAKLKDLKDVGFTEENLSTATNRIKMATTDRIKTGGKKIVAEVKSMGIKGAETLSAQLKEFTTVVDDALIELAKEDALDISNDEDGPLPYSKS